MIQVIICDDNCEILDFYQSLLSQAAESTNTQIKITRFISGEQLLFNLAEKPNSVDIIYLDILLGKMNGIEVAKKLRDLGCHAVLIFLTSSNEYVFEAFDSTPFYYIVKDGVSIDKFKEIFVSALNTVKQKANQYITISSGGVNSKLPLDKIRYFDVQNRLVTAHTVDDNISYYSTLDEVENMLLDKGFVRTHRSYLVNCYYIQRLLRTQIILSDGTALPVSTKYSNIVHSAFSNYLIQL